MTIDYDTVGYQLLENFVKYFQKKDFDEIIKSVNKIGYKAKEASEDNTKKNIKFKIFTPIASLLMTVSLKYFFEAGLDLISY